ncbi:uncharacterized protein LOC115451639 [Manduca sexta]|uniref:uncharacterized protein LOC115451639 n=1 Tax=Manduca sexta TaxID=7130 RepID=UPI00188E01FD|nr:uncharacterized protein LOC115451639 [Manduca sexta]
MWIKVILAYMAVAISKRINTTMFRDEHIIFSSEFNITRLLVPADGNRYLHVDPTDMPSIFFTVSDPKAEGGSCIYVLEGLAAYEVLEGGRDSTSDYSSNKEVYFGAKDGLYIYQQETLSAKKYGPFRDDIIQLQKANGSDSIYILNNDYKMYLVEKNGTVKSKINICANQFVLDTSNNLYYVSCIDNRIHIVKSDDSKSYTVTEEFKNVSLLRPAFMMEKCIPFFDNGDLYVLFSNGSWERKDFYIGERPSAFSVDAALYLVTALNGKIYEFNVMDVLLRSMFGVSTEWPKDVTEIIMSIMDTKEDGMFDIFKWSHG